MSTRVSAFVHAEVHISGEFAGCRKNGAGSSHETVGPSNDVEVDRDPVSSPHLPALVFWQGSC